MRCSAILVIAFFAFAQSLDPCLYHFTDIEFNYYENSGSGGNSSGNWKLQVGAHVKTVDVKRISPDGGVSNGFTLALDAPDALKPSDVKTTAEHEEFYREADVTDKNINENDWFLVCINSNIVAGGKPSTCSRCTVKKACKTYQDGTCGTRFFNASIIYRLTTANQVVVAYYIQDLPAASATLRSKVFYKPSDRYCAPALYDDAVRVIETTVTPNSIAYVTIDGLKANELYFVNTDATVKTKDGSTKELVNYLSGENRIEIRSCSTVPSSSARSC